LLRAPEWNSSLCISAEVNLQISGVSISRAAGFGVGEGKAGGTKLFGKQFGAVPVEIIPVDDCGFRAGPASAGRLPHNRKDARDFNRTFEAQSRRSLVDVSGEEIDL
jgi:hypothetical protein